MKKNFKITVVLVVLHSFTQVTIASMVRNDVDYQYFRDFAENKGKFTVGSSNINIYNKHGVKIGTMLQNLPMIDFSSADRNSAVATAIHPQYIVSVQHNTGYKSVEFGGQGQNPDAHHFSYKIVNRNEYPKGDTLASDYHLPRIHKLITEITPAPVTNAGLNITTYLNKNRFPLFLRIGSGTQHVRSKSGDHIELSDAYNYLTAGAPLTMGGKRNSWFDAKGSLYNGNYGPLITYGAPGDSGSPIYVYDNEEKRWVLFGVLNFYGGDKGNVNTGSIIRTNWNNETINKNKIEINNTESKNFIWTKTGNLSKINNSGSINVTVSDKNILPMDTKNISSTNIDNGKSVYFNGNSGTLILQQNVNQGAGALYFNTNFTVSGVTDRITYLGAGVSVAKGKNVVWKIGNPENDRLSKIGEGTLVINGKGINNGDISVGDGVVVLNQQADSSGNIQAFKNLGITSGRPTVKLSSANQMNPNNIYFGFRGGRLDMNGQSITFNYVQNADDGAKIVNHSKTQTSTLKIIGKKLDEESDIVWGTWAKAGGDIYEGNSRHKRGVKLYFRLIGHPHAAYLPVEEISNKSYQFMSTNREEAIKMALALRNKPKLHQSFDGFIGETNKNLTNGRLNFEYTPVSNENLLAITGGINLNGTVTVNKGVLLLSGVPTPHARNVLKKQDVVFDDDYINRNFVATSFDIKHGHFIVGRNVTEVKGNINIYNDATVSLGFTQGKDNANCIRSLHTGKVDCKYNETLSNKAFNSMPTTNIQSNITLNNSAHLNLGSKAILIGNINASSNSTVKLHNGSHWLMINNSKIGNLNLDNGTITLNPTFNKINEMQSAGNILIGATTTRAPLSAKKTLKINSLQINGNLSGNGTINYVMDTYTGLVDSVIVNGNASGKYQLYVKPNGSEPRGIDNFELLKINIPIGSKINTNKLEIVLKNRNKSIDLGVYRYNLIKIGNTYIVSKKNSIFKQSSYISRFANTALSEISSQINTLTYFGGHLSPVLQEDLVKNMKVQLNNRIQFTKNSSNNYRLYSQSINYLQLLVEKTIYKQFAVGTVLSMLNTSNDFDDNINGKSVFSLATLYGKYLDLKYDFLTSVDLSYGKSGNKIDNSVSFNRHTFITGINVSKIFNLYNINIKPHISIRHYYLTGQDYRLHGADIKIDSINLITYIIGLSLSKTFNVQNNKVKATLSSYYFDIFQNKITVKTNNINLKQEFSTYFKHKFSVGIPIKNWQIDLNAGLMNGREINKNIFLDIKVGYIW